MFLCHLLHLDTFISALLLQLIRLCTVHYFKKSLYCKLHHRHQDWLFKRAHFKGAPIRRPAAHLLFSSSLHCFLGGLVYHIAPAFFIKLCWEYYSMYGRFHCVCIPLRLDSSTRFSYAGNHLAALSSMLLSVFSQRCVLCCRYASKSGLQGFFWLQRRKQRAHYLLDERRKVCRRTRWTH